MSEKKLAPGEIYAAAVAELPFCFSPYWENPSKFY